MTTSQSLNALPTPWYRCVPKGLRENLQFRKQLILQAATDPQLRAHLRKDCAEDLLFWLNVFGWTYNPRPKGRGKLKIPFITWECQDEAFAELERALAEGRDAAFSKSRDMGASWILIAWMYWRWQHVPLQAFLLVSRKEWLVDGSDSSLFAKLDFLRKSQPAWMQPKRHRVKRRLVHSRNGSFINGESTTGNIGRGDRFTAIGCDEFGEMEEAWAVLSATADATDTRVFNSTPTGTQHAFYERTQNAETVQIRLHWSRHPEKAAGLYRPNPDGSITILDKDYVFPANYNFRREIPKSIEQVRSPWYDFQCDRRKHAIEIAVQLDIDFQGSSYKFFGDELLTELKLHARAPLAIGQLESAGPGQHQFIKGGDSLLRLWCPVFNGEPAREQYIVSCDISMGTGASNSVATVTSRYSGAKVAELVTNTLSIPQFARKVVELCEWFHRAQLIWECPGPGLVFTHEIRQAGYANLWCWRDTTKAGSKRSDKPGWFTNGDAKAHLLTHYREALRDGRYVNSCQESLIEAGQYVYNAGKIEHDSRLRDDCDESDLGNNHGDRCIADALGALVLLEHGGAEAVVQPHRPQPPQIGSFFWRREQADLEEVQAQRDSWE